MLFKATNHAKKAVTVISTFLLPNKEQLTKAFLQGGLYKVGELICNDSYPLIEQIINEKIIDASAQQGKKVSCAKGCNSCCHEQVLAQGMEGFATAAWIKKQPRPFRKMIIKKLDRWHKEVERADIDLQLLTPETAYVQASKYWENKIACPFLENGICAIYAARPFACRTMLVTSDPKECQKSKVNAIKVQSNKFEQLVRNEFLNAAQHLSTIHKDKKQQEIINIVSWFPHITKICIEQEKI